MDKYRYYFLLAVLLVAGCVSKSESPKQNVAAVNQPAVSPQPTPFAEEAERSVADVIRQVPFLEKEKIAALLRAWKQVPNHAVCRAVQPSDIRIPHWVEKESYWSDVVHATGWASDYGEMSGAYGLIVFVVDKSIADVNRFGIVVFIERPGNKYTVHWIFRDKDLSRVTLHRHSGNVYIEELREDGTSHTCDVQWDRKQGRWGCELD